MLHNVITILLILCFIAVVIAAILYIYGKFNEKYNKIDFSKYDQSKPTDRIKSRLLHYWYYLAGNRLIGALAILLIGLVFVGIATTVLRYFNF